MTTKNTKTEKASAKAEFAHEDEVATLRALREFDRKNIEKLKQDKADLLAAAKYAADWLSRSVRIDDQEQAQDLRAAIARAEGRQP